MLRRYRYLIMKVKIEQAFDSVAGPFLRLRFFLHTLSLYCGPVFFFCQIHCQTFFSLKKIFLMDTIDEARGHIVSFFAVKSRITICTYCTT